MELWKPTYPANKTSRGASISELLVVLALLGMASFIGVAVVGSIQDRARCAKLLSDVKHLNSALHIYELNGGDRNLLSDPTVALDKLKRTRSESERRRMAGAGTGQLIDPRITFCLLTEEEQDDCSLRAYWCERSRRFAVTGETRPGIKKFYFSESLARVNYGEDENRGTTALTYAEKSNWIWDYVEAPTTASAGPTRMPLHPDVPNSNPPALPPFPDSDPDPPSDDDDNPDLAASGGLALNIGSGSTSAAGGIGVGLLSSGDVVAGEGELAVGLLNWSVNTGSFSTLHVITAPVVSQAGESVGSGAATVSRIATGVTGGIEQNFGRGSAFSYEGIATNLGSGSAGASDGLGLNVGDGNSDSIEGAAANLGGGTSSAANGGAINLGSGSASAGR